jgi:hypothetical protein
MELGEELRLALEARQTLPVVDESCRQDLDGDVALEVRVARAPLPYRLRPTWR